MVVKTAISDKWSDIPDVWKQIKNVKKISYKADPKDKSLGDIMSVYVSTDDLRPAMTGMYFDKQSIVSTDAHRLFMLPNTGSEEGLYEPITGNVIDARFPDYKVIIPSVDIPYKNKINIEKLKTYLTAIITGKYMNLATYQCVLTYQGQSGKEYIAMNSKFVIEMLEGFEKLGYDHVWLGLSSPTRAIYFTADESDLKSPASTFGKKPLGLCMPLMLNSDIQDFINEYGYSGDQDFQRGCKVSYDLTNDAIVNFDGSVVSDWKPKTDWGLPYWSKEESKVATLFTKSNKYIPILEYVKVQNKVAVCGDLETFYLIKDFDVEDGLYLVINSALVNSPDNPDSYPVIPEKEFINKHKFEFLGGLDYATEFIGDDDLRPVMKGVHYKIDDGKVSIEGTDAHGAISISDQYSKSEYPNIDVVIGNPTDLVKSLMTFKMIDCQVSKDKDWLRFTCPKHEIYSRTIDGKFPSIQQVLPNELDQGIYLNTKEINKVIASIKGSDKKGKVYLTTESAKTKVGVGSGYGNDEVKYISEIKSSKTKLESRIPTSAMESYILMATGKELDTISVKYDTIKSYFKVASEICTSSYAGDNDLAVYTKEGGVIALSLINRSFFELNKMVQGEPQKEKAVKPATAKEKPEGSKSKKEELQDAIKGLEMLAKKGNKFAENTVKGLKILLKRV